MRPSAGPRIAAPLCPTNGGGDRPPPPVRRCRAPPVHRRPPLAGAPSAFGWNFTRDLTNDTIGNQPPAVGGLSPGPVGDPQGGGSPPPPPPGGPCSASRSCGRLHRSLRNGRVLGCDDVIGVMHKGGLEVLRRRAGGGGRRKARTRAGDCRTHPNRTPVLGRACLE